MHVRRSEFLAEGAVASVGFDRTLFVNLHVCCKRYEAARLSVVSFYNFGSIRTYPQWQLPFTVFFVRFAIVVMVSRTAAAPDLAVFLGSRILRIVSDAGLQVGTGLLQIPRYGWVEQSYATQ